MYRTVSHQQTGGADLQNESPQRHFSMDQADPLEVRTNVRTQLKKSPSAQTL